MRFEYFLQIRSAYPQGKGQPDLGIMVSLIINYNYDFNLMHVFLSKKKRKKKTFTFNNNNFRGTFRGGACDYPVAKTTLVAWENFKTNLKFCMILGWNMSE